MLDNSKKELEITKERNTSILLNKEKQIPKYSVSLLRNGKDNKNITQQSKQYKVLDFSAFVIFLTGIKKFLFGVTLKESKYIENNEKEISKQIKTPIRFGLLAFVIVFGFFVVWSIFAPLDSASIAEGYVIVSDYRKEIFHEGGSIVEKILVKDGDKVVKKQPLIVLNRYKAKAQLDNDLWQLRYAIVTDQRLSQSLETVFYYQINKRDKIRDVNVQFHSKYLKNDNERVIKLIEAQRSSLKSFNSYIKNSIKSFSTQIDQVYYDIESLNQRIKSYKENAYILHKEYQRKKHLYNQKLETVERLSLAKLELQKYRGQILEDEARISSYKYKITEINTKKANFLDEQNVRLLEEYKKNHTELLRLEAAYISSQNVYNRTTIVAPNSGIITSLNVHTTGSILHQDGRPILQIIPQDVNLVIEAYIPSQEIDSVNIGNEAKIQLNAYKARIVPRIKGTILYISADKLDQQGSGMIIPGQQKLTPVGFYKVKIAITSEELKKINANIKLYPGMPVTVFLIKGTRSFAEYLYSPIRDSFHRAFKEP